MSAGETARGHAFRLQGTIAGEVARGATKHLAPLPVRDRSILAAVRLTKQNLLRREDDLFQALHKPHLCNQSETPFGWTIIRTWRRSPVRLTVAYNCRWKTKAERTTLTAMSGRVAVTDESR